MEADIFKALGDSVRLKMVKRLSSGQEYTMGELTSGLGITRQGARKQLSVLEKANIVRLKTKGREVLVFLNPDSLQPGQRFIETIEAEWGGRLRRLKDIVEGKNRAL